MGRVVAARDERLGRPVAIKEALDADEATLRRFEREVQITARLQHPSIVPLYDAGQWPSGLPYYVMRLVSGRPLSERIEQAGSLADRLGLVPSFLAAADAVGFAHRQGIIHRDLKPANVLIGEHGETVVIDWGLAKVIGEGETGLVVDDDPTGDVEPDVHAPPEAEAAAAVSDSDRAVADTAVGPGPFTPSSPAGTRARPSADAIVPGGPAVSSDAETRVGAVLGTPGYMAPEQAAGDPVDVTSDVYALGATLYHLLAGAPPLRTSRPAAAIAEVLSGPPPPLAARAPGAPPELLAIVDKAMAIERADRYSDASALAADLRRFLTGQLVAAHRYSPRDRIRRFARRHRAALAVAALAALVLVATVAVGLTRIVAARQRAERARVDAEAGWRSAEQARRRAAERADDFLLARARSVLDDDPTAAAALVGRLPLESAQWPRARAILDAARARGIAWALPGRRGLVGILEPDPTGRHLLSSDRDGVIEVHDLQRRTSRVIAELEGVAGAAWADGGRAVAVATATEVLVIDVASGERRTVTTSGSPIVDLEGPDDASFVVWRDQQGNVAEAAPPSWTPAPVVRGAGQSGWIRVSASGGLIATWGRDERVALWKRGRRESLVTGRRDCQVALHPGGARAAFACADEIVEWTVGGARPVRTGRWPRRAGFATPMYGGDVLYDLTGRGEVIALYRGGASETVLTARSGLFPLAMPAGLALASGTDSVVLVERSWIHTLHAPGSRILRLASVAGGRMLAAGGTDGRILLYDLDQVRLRRLALPSGASQILSVTGGVALLANIGGEIERHDLATGAVRQLGSVRAYPERSRASPDGSIAVVISMLGEVAAVRARDGAFELLADEGASMADPAGPDRVVWERGGAVWEKRPFSAEPAHRVVAWPTRITSIASQGEWLAGALADGTLWRRAPGAGPDAVERVQSGRVVGVVAVGADGAVYAAVDRQIWRWQTGAVERFAVLTGPVFDLALDPAIGLSASTTDGAVHLVSLADGSVRTTPLPAAGSPAELSRRGARAVARNGANYPVAIDVAGALADVMTPTWALGVSVAGDGSATSALLGSGELVVASHELPRAPVALRAWLAAATNATVDDSGAVAWP